jgi:hypothetical protein
MKIIKKNNRQGVPRAFFVPENDGQVMDKILFPKEKGLTTIG